MEWYDSYKIGVDRIDFQHKGLVHMISRVQLALSNGGTSQEVGNALKFLVGYTQHHFSEEENIMRSIGYADIENHKSLHRKFVDDIIRILVSLKKGKTIDTYVFVDFLTDWVLNHIRHEDKKIGKALAERQGQAAALVDDPASALPTQE